MKDRGSVWLALVLSIGCGSTARVNGQQGPMGLLEHFEQTSEILPGEPYQVLRMDLDLTGDGVPEMLLSKALSDGRSGEQEWLIYAKAGEGQYRMLGILDFSFQTFRFTEQQKLLVYDKGLGVLATYRLDATGPHEESRQAGVAAGGPEWAAFKSWREAAHLKVLSADLQDLSTSADPRWTDLITNDVVPGVGRLEGTVVQ
jgi:hypothetical protein